MPFQTWSVGQEMLATEFQTYIGNQVVATFTDAAQRAAQLPSPEVGQLSTLDDFPGAVWSWTGTAWVDVAPLVQSGNEVIMTNGAGGGDITYPRPFAAANNPVLLTNGDAASDIRLGVIQAQNFATGFGFIARAGDGSPIVSTNVRVHWLATGTRTAT